MRRARQEDAIRIAEIDNLVFDNGYNERTIGIEISLGPSWVESWAQGGLIESYVITRWDHNITDITRLAVHPSAQGKGLGALLLGMAINSTNGPHMLTVRKNNQKAIALYKKFGFRVVADMYARSWVMKRQ